ncbi:MAG TPA: glycosyltransferase [Chitinivibrionales bacterium]|nr:glycosyltransferase [Chitinivibrionales bacterium]
MHLILIISFLCAILSIIYFSVIIFLCNGLCRISRSSTPHHLRFSIVIAARNEERVIEKCLLSVLSQTIGPERFEVILVNDRSTDATAAIAASVAKSHSNLSVVTITETPQGVSPKKHAVIQGILRAKEEIIVFTDADCIVQPAWLETIDRYFDENTGIVQGITAYAETPGMNKLFWGIQAIDFLSHGVVSAAAIGANLPLNSNANNFAFRKKAFDAASGYGSDSAVVSGDDDLLLQRVWRSTGWRIRYMTDADGKVNTRPTETITGVFEQRKRWGSKTVHYNRMQVGLLSSVFVFYLAIALLFFAGFFKPAFFAPFIAMFLVKVFGEAMLLVPGTRMFGEMGLRKYIVPASLIQLPVVIFSVVIGVFGKFVWKEQKFGRTSK